MRDVGTVEVFVLVLGEAATAGEAHVAKDVLDVFGAEIDHVREVFRVHEVGACGELVIAKFVEVQEALDTHRLLVLLGVKLKFRPVEPIALQDILWHVGGEFGERAVPDLVAPNPGAGVRELDAFRQKIDVVPPEGTAANDNVLVEALIVIVLRSLTVHRDRACGHIDGCNLV